MTNYDLWLGTETHSADIFDRADVPWPTETVSGLPTDGSTIYVRLTSSDGTEPNTFFQVFTYTAHSLVEVDLGPQEAQ